MRPPVPVFFDFACPWSYSVRQFEKRLAREEDLRFHPLPWDLDPSVPPEGQPNPHPVPDDEVVAYAREAGLRLRVPAWRPSTRLALLGVPHALAHGRGDAYVDAAFEAFWERHEDLRDDAVLARIAQDAGLDPEALLAAVHEGTWEAHLQAVDALGEKLGVETTATFVLPDGKTYAGLEGYDALRAALAPAARRAEDAPGRLRA